MQLANDPELEALIGRVCLVFAQVEHEAGHLVASAHGDWSEAMSTSYLEFSADSGLLLDWIKSVGAAYPEAKDETTALRVSLRALKAQRDLWAHSAAIMDLFLLMSEKGLTFMSDRDLGPGRLLNGKQQGHIPPPTLADVDHYCAQASDVGDSASKLATSIARLAQHQVREVPLPKKVSRLEQRQREDIAKHHATGDGAVD